MPVRPLQKESVPTGIADFDKLYRVYYSKEDYWMKAVFTPELAQDFVQLRNDQFFYDGKFKLKEGMLSYRRNHAAKFPKDKDQILAVVEVVNILTAHKNTSDFK